KHKIKNEYEWYYKDDDGMYRLCRHSPMMESSYLSPPLFTTFKVDDYEYDFLGMLQTNLVTRKQRSIQRREAVVMDAAFKEEMKKASMTNASEIMLYHGMSREKPDILDKESLDLRMSKSGVLGNGIYGSFYPYYSYDKYTDSYSSIKTLFYVKFLIGKSQHDK